jgi:hypothetical protein
MHQAGTEISLTYLNDKARRFVEPLAKTVEASLLLPARGPGYDTNGCAIRGDLGKMETSRHPCDKASSTIDPLALI